MDRFGRLDGLVSNAGMGRDAQPDGFDPDAATERMQVNVLTPLALIAAAMPDLAAGASIVDITRINARTSPAGAIACNASKAELEDLTIECAMALGPRGIRVNAVSPGAVERDHAARPPDLIAAFTRETALARLTLDTEVAAGVRCLRSDAASAITGHSLCVSGGFRL
jgi:3-oxoacyl-[acyl-carrier protein] reductase